MNDEKVEGGRLLLVLYILKNQPSLTRLRRQIGYDVLYGILQKPILAATGSRSLLFDGGTDEGIAGPGWKETD